jgi:hypothetical protein
MYKIQEFLDINNVGWKSENTVKELQRTQEV